MHRASRRTAVEVRDRGELLGALSVRMPASDPMNPTKEKLVRDLAAQAGLVLRNVRLVEDLRASRQRLVAAQDEERRRLERNIHDGAQQQLVALAVKARLARQLTERDPAKAAEMLGQIETETQTALEDLRDLARGIYPPLLADRGLVAALEAQSRKAAVSVSIEADAVGPLLRRRGGHRLLLRPRGAAERREVRRTRSHRDPLSQSNGTLSFEVEDDGRVSTRTRWPPAPASKAWPTGSPPWEALWRSARRPEGHHRGGSCAGDRVICAREGSVVEMGTEVQPPAPRGRPLAFRIVGWLLGVPTILPSPPTLSSRSCPMTPVEASHRFHYLGGFAGLALIGVFSIRS